MKVSDRTSENSTRYFPQWQIISLVLHNNLVDDMVINYYY